MLIIVILKKKYFIGRKNTNVIPFKQILNILKSIRVVNTPLHSLQAVRNLHIFLAFEADVVSTDTYSKWYER
jgi:hypothetical protein